LKEFLGGRKARRRIRFSETQTNLLKLEEKSRKKEESWGEGV
jgi:hypothetical protein